MKKYLSVLTIICMCAFSTDLVYSQVPGQTPLDPTTIPQFVDPLPHFAGLRVDASGGNLTISYEPTQQIAVSTGTVLDAGTVGPASPNVGMGNYWAYSVSNGTVTAPAFWPAFTIVAQRGVPVNVTYINNLFGQTYADVNLVADQTLHWANPQGAPVDERSAYTGPVPVVPHLHGAEVASESDGGPDAWFTPGYAIQGPSWGVGNTDQYYYYPNTQEGTTLWFHDHALGLTRLNVYAGLAGFYFLRETNEDALMLPGWSGDDLVQEVAPAGTSGTFNPEPYLPEIEIVFQDRMFDTDGGLYFPNEPTSPSIHPTWTPEFIGDVITVNGKTWPYLSVAPRKYRFRLLNGSNARFYDMTLDDGNPLHGNKVPLVYQIGTDGGFLDAPVPLNSYFSNSPIRGNLLMAPGERADIIIDFSNVDPGSTWTLFNSAGTPYPDGDAPVPGTTDRIMQFVVNGMMVTATDKFSKKGKDRSTLPVTLRNPVVRLSDFAGGINVTPDIIRQLTLNEVSGPTDEPLEALVNNTKWDGNGMGNPGLGETELPTEGTTELWQIINLTGDAHPIHLHLVQFQLVSRQAYDVATYESVYEGEFPSTEYEPASGPPNDYNTPNSDGAVGGNPAISSYLQGINRPPLLNERGWKDTYITYPGEVTTFIIRYAPTDKPIDAAASDLLYSFDPSEGPGYVWHCHIIDHEDNEMMRPYKVMPSPERAAALALQGAALKSGEITASKITDSGIEFSLDQNFPNPFNRETEIVFNLPEQTHTSLILYNNLGQQVQTLINEIAPKGRHSVRLDGSRLQNGIYLYKLTSGSNTSVKRFVVNH